MTRKPHGKTIVGEVYEKAKKIPGVDPSLKRKDRNGMTIARSAYGVSGQKGDCVRVKCI